MLSSEESSEDKIRIGGYNIRELSFFILMAALAFVVIIVGITFAIAVETAEPGDIGLTGNFDIGQFQAIVVGIAITATVLVSQQLTKKDNTTLMTFLERNFGRQAGTIDVPSPKGPEPPTPEPTKTKTPEEIVKESMDEPIEPDVLRSTDEPDFTKLNDSEPTRILNDNDEDNDKDERDSNV